MPKNKGKLQKLKEAAEHSLSLHEWMEIDPVEILKLVAFVEAHDRYWKTHHDRGGVGLFNARKDLENE